MSEPLNRYGLKPLHKIKQRKDGFKYGPEDAILNFLSEISAAKKKHLLSFIHDLNVSGKYIDFTPSDQKSTHDMTSVVHAAFQLSEINVEDAEYFGISKDEAGVLLEHLATGFYFAVYEKEGELDALMVHDFSGNAKSPSNIRIASQFEIFDDLWNEVAPDSPGTRMGGVPLNSDGLLYDGPWPHAEDGYFSFIGQYQLPDGRYIHQFANYDAEEYDYSVMGDEDIDPYSVALVEGEAVREGVVVKMTGERSVVYPDIAYAQKPCESVKKYPPSWIQGDGTLRDPDYEFLIGYGFCQGPGDAEKFSFGDMYLFWNPKTGDAKTLMQYS